MRVALFLATLAALFGAAVVAGGAFGPEPSGEPPATHAAAAEQHDENASPAAAAHGDNHDAPAMRGLATADEGLRLVIATPEFDRGRTRALRFRIIDAHDRPVRSFELSHEKRMHAIVVRRDLTAFQHLHPRMQRDGTWSVQLRLDAPGSYRLYADFRRAGEAHTLAGDLRVDGSADLRPLPAPASRAIADGGDIVRLDAGRPAPGTETTLRFSVARDGAPVALAPYLGAGGHLVALRDGDLAFLHVHPVGERMADGRVTFAATFPSAGDYRLFLQYRDGARVRTAAFTLEVAS